MSTHYRKYNRKVPFENAEKQKNAHFFRNLMLSSAQILFFMAQGSKKSRPGA